MTTTLPAIETPGMLRRVEPAGIFSSPERFEFSIRVAKVFAASHLVPAHFRGQIEDCLLALHMADRLGDDPLITMQSMMIINGRPGFLTSYLIARANSAGVFHGRITWASVGDGKALEVTAQAVLADTGELVSAAASMAMAEAEGWTKNAKYKSMPEHMLRYRSAAMLIRLYAPEVMLGMLSAEEVETIEPSRPPRDVTPPRRQPARRPPNPAGEATASAHPAPPAEPPEIDFALWLSGFEDVLAGCRTLGDLVDADQAQAGERAFSAGEAAKVRAMIDRRRAELEAKADQALDQDFSEESEADMDELTAAVIERGEKAAKRGGKALKLWYGGLKDEERRIAESHGPTLRALADAADKG